MPILFPNNLFIRPGWILNRSTVLLEEWMDMQLTLSCFSKIEIYNKFIPFTPPHVYNVGAAAELFA